ncbi:hypothetical protein [Massilia sp. TSP1-1-2]|uniref:hypothetical protein n=1 Tax=Massilia sp. TSP1-1-2 TaxID=2804649 RepID=UPI003CF7B920
MALLALACALAGAAQVGSAVAGEMYKCRSVQGKLAYSRQPCPGNDKVIRQFTVPAPAIDEGDRDRAVVSAAQRTRNNTQQLFILELNRHRREQEDERRAANQRNEARNAKWQREIDGANAKALAQRRANGYVTCMAPHGC